MSCAGHAECMRRFITCEVSTGNGIGLEALLEPSCFTLHLLFGFWECGVQASPGLLFVATGKSLTHFHNSASFSEGDPTDTGALQPLAY